MTQKCATSWQGILMCIIQLSSFEKL